MGNLESLTTEERVRVNARALETKRRISTALNVHSVKASRRDDCDGKRKPHELPDIRTAVKWKCYDCMGWEPDGAGSLLARVMDCQCPHCPLYSWRGGSFDMDLIPREKEDE